MHTKNLMEQNKPKTFKIVIPGDVLVNIEQYRLDDGSIITIENKKKVVVPSKKNSMRIGMVKADEGPVISVRTGNTLKPVMLSSSTYDQWRSDQMVLFNKAAAGMAIAGYSLPIARAKIKVHFYFGDSFDRDLSNKFETIADMLVDAGIIIDDSFKVLKPITLDGWVCRDHPCTIIYLTLITGEMEEYGWDKTSAQHEINLKKRKKKKRQVRTLLKNQVAADGLK